MFENVVKFLTAYAGNEEFTRALDPNKASAGEDEEAMKVSCWLHVLKIVQENFQIYVAALYEMRLLQQEALVSIVHTLSDTDQIELTHLVSHAKEWFNCSACL